YHGSLLPGPGLVSAAAPAVLHCGLCTLNRAHATVLSIDAAVPVRSWRSRHVQDGGAVDPVGGEVAQRGHRLGERVARGGDGERVFRRRREELLPVPARVGGHRRQGSLLEE